MMSFVLGLAKSAKFWIVSVAVIGVTALLATIWADRYEQGYNAAELKWQQAQAEAIADAVAEARRLDAIAHEAAIANIEREVEIVERVKIVEREVPKIVERVVRPECRDLGPDIQRLYNDAIRAGYSLPRPDPEPAAEPDREMPDA